MNLAAPRIGTPQVLFTLAVAILVVVVAVPVLLIFFNAFWVDGHFNVADVVKILKQKETYEALLNSLFLASGVTITGTIVGTFFAWLVTRTDLPFKGAMKVLFLVPLIGGAYLGHWLDGLNEGYSTRWSVNLILLGLVLGIFNVIVFVRKYW